MLTPQRSAGVFVVVRVLIRCVVTGQEGALAERPCVLSAASSMAPGIVLAPSQRVKTLRQRQGLVTLSDPLTAPLPMLRAR